MVQPGLQAFVGPLARAFAPIILWHAERMVGTTTSDIVPEKAASLLGERPLFIVHGEDDPLIPVESAHRIHKAASGPSKVWTVPDCTHAQAPSVATEEYTRRVNEFFQAALDVHGPTQ